MTLRDTLQRALGEAYELDRELEGGGMSRLWIATDRNLGRRVVVKVLPRERGEALSLERFRAEIRVLTVLQHPNVVSILAAGEVENLPYYVMPFIEGESARRLLTREGTISPRRVLSILRDVTRACAFAHSRGIVHRDIKPDNILLAGDAALITDFGVAKALAAATHLPKTGTITREGFTVGTPVYMSPEQLAGDPKIDHRADFYALGVTAYEMLTGTPPFAHLTPQALLVAQLTESAPAVATVRPEVPIRLSRLIGQCLEKQADRRPKDAEALLAALDDPQILSGERAVTSTAVLQAVRPRSIRRRLVAGIGIAALASVTIVASLLTARRSRSAPSASGGNASRIALAVIPFSDSALGSDGYLATGVTDGVSRLLGGVPAIRLAPRAGAERFHQGDSIPEIGKTLSVDYVLEGSVRRSGGALEIDAELKRGGDGSTVDQRTIRGPDTALARLSNELAAETLKALGRRHGRLSNAALDSRTAFRNPEAYDRYLRGIHAFRRRGADALGKALAYLSESVAIDSTAAPAQAGLAAVYSQLPLYAGASPSNTLPRALAAAEKAVALDSTLAAAHAALGNVLGLMWRREEGMTELRHALQLDSTFAEARQWYGEQLLLVGRFADAERELKAAATLDPWSPIAVGLHAVAMALDGRPDKGIQEARRATDLDPKLAAPRILLGAVYLYAQRPFDAVFTLAGALELEPSNPAILGLLGYAYGSLGQTNRARELLARLSKHPAAPGAAGAMARIHLALGHPDEAIQQLERAVRERDPLFVSEPLLSPIFEPLRAHPRFLAVLEQVAIPAGTAGGAG